MKAFFSLLLFALVFAPLIKAQEIPSEAQKEIVLGNNSFSFQFLQEFNKQNTQKNFAFSPISLSAGFVMAYAGSAKNTQNQIQKAFGFGDNNSTFHRDFGQVLDLLRKNNQKPYLLSISNAAFIQNDYKIKKSYLNNIADNHKAEFQLVNFRNSEATHPLINEWGNKESKGLIKNVLSTYDPNIKLLLLNLTFCDAKWQKVIDKSEVKNDTFFTYSKPLITPFMHKIEDKGKYLEGQSWQMVAIPTHLEDCSIIFLQAKDNHPLDNLIQNPPTEVIDYLNNEDTFEVFDKKPQQKINLYFPKFEIDNSINPINILESMGVKDAFSESVADFSGITSNPEGLFIFIVEHNCKVIVNETGIKAAASTAIAFKERSINLDKGITVNLNKPFLFFVRDDKTKTILFVGKVVNPTVPKE
jgi:serine protease inhibitor